MQLLLLTPAGETECSKLLEQFSCRQIKEFTCLAETFCLYYNVRCMSMYSNKVLGTFGEQNIPKTIQKTKSGNQDHLYSTIFLFQAQSKKGFSHTPKTCSPIYTVHIYMCVLCDLLRCFVYLPSVRPNVIDHPSIHHLALPPLSH